MGIQALVACCFSRHAQWHREEVLEDKGFGFITPDDGGEDVFVHRKCNGEDRTAYLESGAAVTYEVEWDDRKGKYSASSCTPFRTGATSRAVAAKVEAGAEEVTLGEARAGKCSACTL